MGKAKIIARILIRRGKKGDTKSEQCRGDGIRWWGAWKRLRKTKEERWKVKRQKAWRKTGSCWDWLANLPSTQHQSQRKTTFLKPMLKKKKREYGQSATHNKPWGSPGPYYMKLNHGQSFHLEMVPKIRCRPAHFHNYLICGCLGWFTHPEHPGRQARKCHSWEAIITSSSWQMFP